MACQGNKILKMPVGSPERNAAIKECFDEQAAKKAKRSQRVRDKARKRLMARKPPAAPNLTPKNPYDAVKREFSSKTYNP